MHRAGRVTGAVIAILALLVTATSQVSPQAAGQEGDGPPRLAGLAVTGAGVSTYPAFNPNFARFGIRTSAETGPLTVTATTEAPGDVLTIGGQPATSGRGKVFRGMKPGEQITVRVANANGERTYDLTYLPPNFPVINVTTRRPGIAPGFLYLGFFTGPPYLAVVDNNGVPVFVHRRPASTYDFKRQPDGRYTFLETTDDRTSLNRTIFDAVIMDRAMRVVARRRTLPPLTNTDNHEVLLLPGGRRILLAYEPGFHDGAWREDSVIQEVANGRVVMQWNSWGDIPLSDNLSGNLVEYAHINSVWVDDDNNLIASLRGVSALVKINRRTGRLMWTLGGRSSDFDIDDPVGGFCGQHHAQRLPNGNILLFDNGADCAPNANDRGWSRAVEYAVDEQAKTAEVVWSHEERGIYGFATGSVQRMANGNTLIGWGTTGIITEVSEDGQELFRTRPQAGGINALSYRAHKAPFPDHIRPRVHVTSPAANAVFIQGQRVRAAYGCYDEGGSSLATCDGSVRSGRFLDTSTPGEHTLTVTAIDEAGNQRRITRTYEVTPSQPDLAVRRNPDGRLVGNNVYSAFGAGQTRTGTVGPRGQVSFTVRVENDGTERDTYLIGGTKHDNRFRVRYFNGNRDVTAAVKDESYRLRRLEPRERRSLRVVVTARPGAPPGSRINVFVLARSLNHPERFDMVKMEVRRRR